MAAASAQSALLLSELDSLMEKLRSEELEWPEGEEPRFISHINASIDLKVKESRSNVERRIKRLEDKFNNLKEYAECLVSLRVTSEEERKQQPESDLIEPEMLKQLLERVEKMEVLGSKCEEKELQLLKTIQHLKLRNGELVEKFQELHALTKESLGQMEMLLIAKEEMKMGEAEKMEFLTKQNHTLISQNEFLKRMAMAKDQMAGEREQTYEKSRSEQMEQIQKLIDENESLRAEEMKMRERCLCAEKKLKKIQSVLMEEDAEKTVDGEDKMSVEQIQESLLEDESIVESETSNERSKEEVEEKEEEEKVAAADVEEGRQLVGSLITKEPTEVQLLEEEKSREEKEEYEECAEAAVGAPDYAWMISEETCDEHIRYGQFHSGTFELLGYGLKAHIYAEPTPTTVNIRVLFMCEPAMEEPVVLPSLTCILRDRYDFRCMDKRFSLTFPFKVQQYKSMNFTFPNHFFNDSVKSGTQNFYVDYKNRIRVQLFIERPEVARNFFSTDGLLRWRISGFSEKKRLAQKQLVDGEFSPYFYTGPRGYRVQLKLQLCQKERCVLGVMFLTGSHDASLASTFSHSTSVTVVNARDSLAHLSKRKVWTMEGLKTYFGIVLGSMEQIERLVEEDALLLRVEIKPFVVVVDEK